MLKHRQGINRRSCRAILKIPKREANDIVGLSFIVCFQKELLRLVKGGVLYGIRLDKSVWRDYYSDHADPEYPFRVKKQGRAKPL